LTAAAIEPIGDVREAEINRIRIEAAFKQLDDLPQDVWDEWVPADRLARQATGVVNGRCPFVRRPSMTVAYAALHQTLRYRGEDTGLHVLAFQDRTMFFSRQQPRFFDALAKPVAPREVLPGSYVNVRYHIKRGVNRMMAIQIVHQPEEVSPFDPILDDGQV
jgi:hypothetical protein